MPVDSEKEHARLAAAVGQQVGRAKIKVDRVAEGARPLQRNAKGVADRAVGTVAADQILRAHGFVLSGFEIVQLGRHAAIGLLEGLEPRPIAQRHRRPRTRESLQDRVEPKLRADLQTFGAEAVGLLLRARRPPHPRQLMAAETRYEHHVERMVGGEGTVAYVLGDVPAPAEFHGAGVDLVHLRGRDRAVALLDQFAGDAAPAEFGGEREPDRTTTDDQHRDMTRGARGLLHQDLLRL